MPILPAVLARHDHANKFTQPQTAPQYNIGDADARIKRVGTAEALENAAGDIILSMLTSGNFAPNAVFDGTDWNRIDTAKPASLFVVDRGGTLNLYTVAAGANPIAWSGPYPVMRGGMSHASVKMSADQAVAANTYTKLAFDTENVDVLGDFDTAAYRFTAPEVGVYDISAGAFFKGNADGTRSLLTIYLNGAEYRRGLDVRQGSAGDITCTVDTSIRMLAGDYVEAFVYCSVATTVLALAYATWFNISRVQ